MGEGQLSAIVKAALVVNPVGPDVAANLASILALVEQACDAGAMLIVLPEAALTGLINNDEPDHDLPLGQMVPGPATDEFGRVCRRRGVWLGFGLLERDGRHLYDTAVLIGPDGAIWLKYRRIQQQWHGQGAYPAVYAQGVEVPVVATSLGNIAFLICGDLFDDGIVAQARQTRADWLLFPFARCFPERTIDQARWDRDEMPAYCERVAMTGCTTLMANYLSGPELDACFGGAAVVGHDGALIVQYPLGVSGMLIVDL
jgi:predicted amidohydrolase